MNNTIMNISSGPHTRDKLTTSRIMYTVIAALLPATIVGIFSYGLSAFLVLLCSVVTAVLTEYLFNLICKKPQTIKDGSAVVTGLLLALSLPPTVPVYIPIIGALFGIGVAKCCFGGLGKNFINPALAGRCFVLISFSNTVTTFKVDAVSSATPLAVLKSGKTVNITQMFLGTSNAVIGSSILALLIGGLALWAMDIIHGEICFSILISFTAFIAIFGGQGLDPRFLAAHLCGGGVVMGAFFMATDYTTSPVSRLGQMVYGCLIGILGAMFRVFGSAADSFSYSIIIANLFVPMIDMFIVPKPYGYRKAALEKLNGEPKKTVKEKIPIPVIVLGVITLIAGAALSGVFNLTKDAIEEQKLLAATESYKEVCPEAETFETDEAVTQAITDLDGQVYGTDFGRSYINSAVIGKDASGNTAGYVVSATSSDGYDGTITISVGLNAEGTVNGISFTELHETPGMGMRCDEPEFKSQFSNKTVDRFVLNKAGTGSTPEEIDTITGASTSSGAVVNAVNAALDFYANHMKGGE